jgi:hypothetical protein
MPIEPPWPRHDDWGFRKVRDWQLKRCWWPQHCFLTGKQLWGQLAYRGIRIITGPGEPVLDYYWIAPNEFILAKLKGKI